MMPSLENQTNESPVCCLMFIDCVINGHRAVKKTINDNKWLLWQEMTKRKLN